MYALKMSKTFRWEFGTWRLQRTLSSVKVLFVSLIMGGFRLQSSFESVGGNKMKEANLLRMCSWQSYLVWHHFILVNHCFSIPMILVPVYDVGIADLSLRKMERDWSWSHHTIRVVELSAPWWPCEVLWEGACPLSLVFPASQTRLQL